MSALRAPAIRRPAAVLRVRQSAVRGLRTIRRLRGHRPPGPGRPPVTPAGWSVAPPEFVGIGAQKAGTSWWAALINAHARVHRVGSQPKELHFFDSYWERRFGQADIDLYAEYFPRPPGAIAGEWTPGYMVDFWTPEMLARAAPQVRVLILLRDPLERYLSSMAHTDQMSSASLDRQDAMGAFQRGLYAQQLRRVFDSFARDRVLILQYEKCRADPSAELARTFRFLGLEPEPVDAAVSERLVNAATRPKPELPSGLRDALVSAYQPDLAELAGLAPELDLSLWPSTS